MNNAQRYIELCRKELRARGERDSDNNLSKWLGVTRTAVGNWKKGKNGIDVITGYRIAKLLKKDALLVVKELHDDGFKEDELRQFFTEALASKRSNDAA